MIVWQESTQWVTSEERNSVLPFTVTVHLRIVLVSIETNDKIHKTPFFYWLYDDINTEQYPWEANSHLDLDIQEMFLLL
jgi:hypothetical protein